MNKIETIYCRTFQTGMKLALPLLPYRQPKTLRSMQQAAEVLEKKRIYSALLVTDAMIRGMGLTKELETACKEAGIHLVVYDQVVANPTTVNVKDALQLYYSHACQAIIGFGGGSSMDCAKAVGARVARPHTSLAQMKGILKVVKKLPLLIAIPTTAGTGSETTLAAIITDAESRHKYCINDFPLIPRYAVLDPKVTLSLPASITATTGMDALTHAVEAYIGRSSTPGTRKSAIMAVDLIFHNLDTAVFDGSNKKARQNMLRAAYYAGCAFTKSYVGYVHAVAHSLGGEYNVPHGLANAILLPFVLEEYGEEIYPKLHKLANAAGLTGPAMSDEKGAKIFIQAIKDMKTRYGIGDTIPQIREEDIDKLSSYAAKEANPLYPVPVLMNQEELKKFYYILME